MGDPLKALDRTSPLPCYGRSPAFPPATLASLEANG